MTAERASKVLAQLRENARNGSGPRMYAELRLKNELAEQAQKVASEQEQAEKISFGQFWEEKYLPNAILTKKRVQSKARNGFIRRGLSLLWEKSSCARLV